MKKDATFKWDDKEFVDSYTKSANVIMPERQRCIRVLLEIVAFHFQNLSGLNILNLGCGDGIITKYIYNQSPNNNFFLVDASVAMLNKAKANLNESKISYRHLTFEDYCESQSEDNKYHLVLSANAIYHLDFIKNNFIIYKNI